VSKGGYSVTLALLDGIAENMINTLKKIAGKGGTGSSNQSGGPKETILIDLLRITQTYHIESVITKTDAKSAYQVKEDLKSIVKGGGINGGEITMVYEDESLSGYIETLTIKKISNDNAVAAGYTGNDSAEYRVTFDFVKGESV